TVAAWQALAVRSAWSELVADLLRQHYDPAYLKSLSHNYPPTAADQTFHTADLSPAGLRGLARTILDAAP
ncbi:MAG: tRNA 2-selenouridine(34) synthase MnmH, partial [Thiobacillus sp.]